MSYETNDLGRDYSHLIAKLLEAPDYPTRGSRTKELLDFNLTLTDPTRCITSREGFSHKFMDEEIVQLLAGVHDNDRLRKITPQAAQLITPKTAYGPRVKKQLVLVEKELRNDPYSRRAIVYIGNADDLKSIGKATGGEMPCTCLWQFFIRDGLLYMQVTMRSWDAVWGLGYDVPSFVAVQMAMAKATGAGLGTYAHRAGSFHIYERHWDISVGQNNRQLEIPWLRDRIKDTQAAAERHLR